MIFSPLVTVKVPLMETFAMKYRMTFRTLTMTSLAAMLISCGGEDNSPNSNNPIQADETLQAGGASMIECEEENTFLKSERLDRFNKFCLIANMAYADASSVASPEVKLTVDFKDTGHDYLHDERIHTGIDFAGKDLLDGSSIAALADGIVEFKVKTDKQSYIVIRSYLPEYGYFALGYMHMSDIAVDVGDKVSQGQIIGQEDKIGAESTHLHLDAISCNQVKKITSWDPSNKETWGNTFEDNGLQPLVIDLYDLVDPIVAGEPIVPPGPFWTCIDPTWNGGGSNPVYGSVEAFDYLNLDVINRNNEVVTSQTIASPSKADNGRISLYDISNDKYTYLDATKLGALPSGNYTLRAEAQINGELKYDSFPFYLTASNETEFADLSLHRPYIYVGEEIEVTGCIATTNTLGSLDVSLVQPSGSRFSHLWSPTVDTARIKNTADCNGRPGYEVDRLTIKDNRGKYEGSYSELGTYGVDITMNFEDGSSTVLDRMTFEYKNQIKNVTLTRTAPPGSSLLLEIHYIEPSAVDNWRIPNQGTTSITLDGFSSGGGSTMQFEQSPDGGYRRAYQQVNFFNDDLNRYIVTGDHEYELKLDINGMVLSNDTLTIIQP